MKKLITLLVAFTMILGIMGTAHAKHVDGDTAKKAAKGFLMSRPYTVAPEMGYTHTVYDGEELIAYVTDVESGGFVVTSADTDVRAVLAFSRKDKFAYGEHSNNVLLHMIKFDVKGHSKENSNAVKAANAKRWGQLSGKPSGKGEPDKNPEPPQTWPALIETTWDQGSPYNDKVPLIAYNTTKRRWAGCGAIALAQILNYWQKPVGLTFNGEDHYISVADDPIDFDGNAEAYGFPKFDELQKALGSVSYDWTNNANQLPYFIFGVGVKLNMQYGRDGSGSYIQDVANVLRKDFGYTSVIVKYSTSRRFWNIMHDTVVQNIKDSKPVELAVYGNAGGHAIVADGYMSPDDFFHLNMGWGGYEDAWYSLPEVQAGGFTFTIVGGVAYDIWP